MEIEKGNDAFYFPELTGVRAIAVYLVYLHHTNPFHAETFGPFLNRLVREFHIGVSIFFVLSGFLIALRYFDQSNQKNRFKKYMQNRIARVYPMYFLLTTVSFLALLLQNKQGEHPVMIYLMNISFLRGFFDDLKFTLVGQGWSLTVEELFYIAAPLLFIMVKKSKWSMIFLPFSLIIVGCLMVEVSKGIDFYGFFDNYSFMFIYTFFGRCFEFFCGIGLALYFKDQITKEKKGSEFTFVGLAIMILLIVIMSSLGAEGQFGMENVFGIVINNFLLPVSIALFFYGLMREKTMIKKILSSGLFIAMGKASYTFYLIHVGVFYTLIHDHFTTNYLVIFLGLNLIAMSLWHFVEEPANKAIRNL
jgi:peptidoglycan/LPS O-acetylase OafA/YrhL